MAFSDQVIEAIVFSEELTQAQRESFVKTLQQDPALFELFERWHLLRKAIEESMENYIPDRGLLVLYAIDSEGRDEWLSDIEKHELERARPVLERAFRAHPAFGEIVQQIRRDLYQFEEVWDQHFIDRPVSGYTDRSSILRALRGTATLQWGWRIAASLAIVAFASILLMMLQRDNNLITVSTRAGEFLVIDLADGSTVRLAGESDLSYVDPSRDVVFDRRVELNGQAFFDISPGQEGFLVITPSARATVLGTSFGVQAGRETTEVVMATGKLALAPVNAPERVVVLEEGQMSRVAANSVPTPPVEVDLSEALSWTGLFIFRATPLEKIADQLSRHYQIPITVSNSLADELITGTYSPELSVVDILSTISATLGAALDQTGDGGYLLKPAE